MEIGRVTPILFTLASRNLFQDRVRLIVTLVGIVFSVVLFTVELGLFFGFQRTVTIMIDHASADLWIAPAETKSFEATALLDGRERFRAQGFTRRRPTPRGARVSRWPGVDRLRRGAGLARNSR